MTSHHAAFWTSTLLLAAMLVCGCANEDGDKSAQELAQAQRRADSLKTSQRQLALERNKIEDRLRQLEEERNALAAKVDLLGKELNEGQRKAAQTQSEARQESLVAARASLQATQETLQLAMKEVADSIKSVEGLLSKAEEQAEDLAKESRYVSHLECRRSISRSMSWRRGNDRRRPESL
jgi:chromosome segregation ATPase